MTKKIYDAFIAKTIREFLEWCEIDYTFDDEQGQFSFSMGLSGSIKVANYEVIVKKDEYVVYAILPIGVSDKEANTKTAMALFACYVNAVTTCGNFVYLPSDGTIAFKYYVDCSGNINLPTDVVANSILIPSVILDKYSAGIIAIILENATAKDAIKRCENLSKVEETSPELEESDG